MLIGILLGLLLAAADLKFIKPRKSLPATLGVSYLTTSGVFLLDRALVPYTLIGYVAGFAGALVLYGLVVLILAILPEVEEL